VLRPRRALAQLEALVRSYPDVPWAHQELRNFHRRNGFLREAATWQERATSASDSADWIERQRSAAARQTVDQRFPTWPRSGETIWSTAPSAIADGLSEDRRSVLVTNSTDQIRSYAVEVEMKRGDRLIGIFRGTGHALRPGERRALLLAPPPPPRSGAVSVAIASSSAEVDRSALIDVAGRIRLEEPTVVSDLGLEVLVTNDDHVTHSFSIQAVLGYEDRFVHLLTGTVSEIAPGQSKAIALIGAQPMPTYTQVLLAVDEILE
jgi:hypothetical protein